MSRLTGIRVADFSRVLAGPWATQVLADLGADVVKVEMPGTGDETRGWGPPFVAGESAYFLAANRGKRSLTVNLKHPEGQEVARRLIRAADVMVENFKPGDLARYGLDYDHASAINPRLIYCSITGFGTEGPRASQPGYDLAIQAMSGIMASTGEPRATPVKVGVAWIDVMTGLHAVIAILVALREVERTGRGQHVDLALFDVGVSAMANVGQAWLATHRPPERFGTGHPQIVPYQMFTASDGHFVVAVGNDAQFRRLCEALGEPGAAIASDPRFATNESRVKHRDAVSAAVQAIVAGRPVSHWVESLTERSVPAAPVYHVGQALSDPQAQARGLVWEVNHPVAGLLPLLASPLQHMGSTPATPAGPPPTLGQHTGEVLRELGYPPGEIERLHGLGAI